MENSAGKKIAYVNGVFIAANVIYFIYIEFAGSSSDTNFMVRSGAMYTPLILMGEYYRLVTSMFMHFGIDHILNNMLVLFILGDNLERALGHFKYLIFYLVTGVAANIISQAVNIQRHMIVVSAGASGAVFGVIGGLLYAVARNKGRLEDLSTSQLVVVILFSLYHGFTSAGIDNAAHIGGLIAGIIMGALLYRKPYKTTPYDTFEIEM